MCVVLETLYFGKVPRSVASMVGYLVVFVLVMLGYVIPKVRDRLLGEVNKVD